MRSIAQNAGFEGFAVYSIEMAVDEACSNIIEHAYGGEGIGEINCTCTFDAGEDALTITLKDRGKSFDPSAVPSPNLSSELAERKANGLGLYFIRQWMDEVSFRAGEFENILIMVKRK